MVSLEVSVVVSLEVSVVVLVVVSGCGDILHFSHCPFAQYGTFDTFDISDKKVFLMDPFMTRLLTRLWTRF